MADTVRKLRPFELARWQLDRDQERMRRMPVLLARKQSRMSASPFAFLRGSAPLFYRVLRQRAAPARGPRGRGHALRRPPPRELRRVPAGPALAKRRPRGVRPERRRRDVRRTAAPRRPAGPHQHAARRPRLGLHAAGALELAEALLDGYRRGARARGGPRGAAAGLRAARAGGGPEAPGAARAPHGGRPATGRFGLGETSCRSRAPRGAVCSAPSRRFAAERGGAGGASPGALPRARRRVPGGGNREPRRRSGSRCSSRATGRRMAHGCST